MRRALILIISLTVFCLGCGLWLDAHQTSAARGYLRRTEEIRQQVLSGRFSQALAQQREVHALWIGDSRWLKCLISHQYIRAVDAALLRLATALEQGWREEALMALDEVFGALTDVGEGHRASWVNVM